MRGFFTFPVLLLSVLISITISSFLYGRKANLASFSHWDPESNQPIPGYPSSSEAVEPTEEPIPRFQVKDSYIRTQRGSRLIFSETYKLLFAGDFMIDWGVQEAIREYGGILPFEDWEPVFYSVDKRILNLESVILSKPFSPFPGKAFVFASPEDLTIPILLRLRVDILTLGNNHAMDYGEEGLWDTMKILQKNKIQFAGAGENKKSYMPVRWKEKESEFSLFSASDVREKNFPFSGPRQAGVAILDEEELRKRIRKEPASSNSILVLHWGLEYNHEPTQSQRRMAKRFVDMGFSAIVGHHPHVPQGIEIYKDKPIVYSLGNFIFGSRNHYLTHNIVIILHFLQNRPILVEVVPSHGRFQTSEFLYYPLAPSEAEEYLEEYAILCRKLGTELTIRGGRGYVFLDKSILRTE